MNGSLEIPCRNARGCNAAIQACPNGALAGTPRDPRQPQAHLRSEYEILCSGSSTAPSSTPACRRSAGNWAAGLSIELMDLEVIALKLRIELPAEQQHEKEIANTPGEAPPPFTK